MAEIVLAYCSSHAPMMSSQRDAAPAEQRNNFFGALDFIKEEAVRRDVNFFLENFPQICIGLGEKNWGPTEEWLPIDKVWIPGHAGLANHIATYTLNHGFDPAFSHQLELDHGIMTVYYELNHEMKLPLVPIVQNCAVPPLMPVRRAYEFGKALGDACSPAGCGPVTRSPWSEPAASRTGSGTPAWGISTRNGIAGSSTGW